MREAVWAGLIRTQKVVTALNEKKAFFFFLPQSVLGECRTTCTVHERQTSKTPGGSPINFALNCQH
jgi:hypothetical protein